MTKIRDMQKEIIHTCRKYYKVCYALYPLQDRNDVIPKKIHISVQPQ